MTKTGFFKELQEIIHHSIFISTSTEQLAQEIQHNCWYISVDNVLLKQISLTDLNDFLSKVKNNRKEQLKKSGIVDGVLFYLWHDVQAAQLRFNFINKNHKELPFAAKIQLVDTQDEIINHYLNADLEQESEETEETTELVVAVYQEVITIQ